MGNLSLLLNVYKGFIRSVLDWGSQVFSPLSDPVQCILDKMQFACLRVPLALMRSTPTNVLLDINGELPLACRFRLLTKRFLAKVVARRSHPLLRLLPRSARLFAEGHRDDLGSLLLYYNIFHHFFRQIKTFLLPNYLEFPFSIRFLKIPVDVETGSSVRSSNDPSSCWTAFVSEFGASNILYTDGSKRLIGSFERTSYAVISLDPPYSFCKRINNHSTVFDAEASAILHAVQLSLDRHWPDTIIASDSLSVLTCLCNPDPHGHHSLDIYKIKASYADSLLRGIRIRFVWIPGHIDIAGNESADSAAKRALEFTDPFSTAKCHYRNLYS